MTYIPKRDYRFEYLTEAANFIEDRQCVSCSLKSDRPEFPMCFELEAILMDESPVEEWDDLGDEGLVCTKYKEIK